MSRRDWSPIFKESLKPFVINKQVLSPVLVNSVFVATVVPILTSLIKLEHILLFFFVFKNCLIPSMIASL